ncbi:unnamed protein product [Prunus armeniaca]|uniref:Uncharacterized protein n=1 Tax=Prunus armeniaca TaxID=36596 RepID=A0A6J5WB88_PRUAR|nr:unnamed protein product [Prunus armeniaca]
MQAIQEWDLVENFQGVLEYQTRMAALNKLSSSRKRTQDGFAIYTEEELGINKADAGSTPVCPFDCSCCF